MIGIESIKKKLLNRITTKEASVGVIGLGYVGLPLAMELASAGFKVIGIDINREIVNNLNQGESHILDVAGIQLKEVIKSGNFLATDDFSVLADLDTVSVCVPTPLNINQEPDTSYMTFTSKKIERHMKKPLLILLESTTYPGTTRELFAMEFEKANKHIDKDYFLCFSPERVDPGNLSFQTKSIPKVIGGLTPASTELGKVFYGAVLDKIVTVSSPEVAEMSKLLENTFRSINIAFINEMALMSERMGIDIWETIDAAATKPFGFMPFYPGPGVGGHCIPLDPMYLHWKAKQSKFFNKFIETAQDINMNMPYNVVNKVKDALNSQSKSINEANILLVGVSYKPNINDVRESPALHVYEILKENKAKVTVLDPFVSKFYNKDGEVVKTVNDSSCDFSMYDCVVILTKHDNIKYTQLLNDSSIIVDTQNAFNTVVSNKIYKIGGGR